MTRAVRIALDGAAPEAAAMPAAPSPVVQLRSAVDARLEPFERLLVGTGAHVALPSGCGGFVVPCADAARRGLVFANAPGLIDEGYRGEVGLISVNLDAREPIEIRRGDHIADMLVMETAACAVAMDGGDEHMATGPVVNVRVLDEAVGVPAFAHATDNGMDLRCAEAFRLEPFERREVRLGIAIGLSEGLVAQIQPRSGLSLKQGLSIAGSPRLLANPSIDDELVIPFVNLDPREPIEIGAGTRVAQLVVFQAEPVEVRVVDSLDDTDRGEGGFGSTGA